MAFNAKMPASEDWFKSDGQGLSAPAIHYLGNLEKTTGKFNLLGTIDGYTDELDGQFTYPENATEIIVADAKFARKILEITVITQVGTATLTPKIGSTTLGGGASSATTSKSTVTHSTANEMAIGDTLNFILSSVSSDCVRLAWTMKFTRAILST